MTGKHQYVIYLGLVIIYISSPVLGFLKLTSSQATARDGELFTLICKKIGFTASDQIYWYRSAVYAFTTSDDQKYVGNTEEANSTDCQETNSLTSEGTTSTTFTGPEINSTTFEGTAPTTGPETNSATFEGTTATVLPENNSITLSSLLVGRINVSCDNYNHNVTLRINSTIDNGSVWQCTYDPDVEGPSLTITVEVVHQLSTPQTYISRSEQSITTLVWNVSDEGSISPLYIALGVGGGLVIAVVIILVVVFRNRSMTVTPNTTGLDEQTPVNDTSNAYNTLSRDPNAENHYTNLITELMPRPQDSTNTMSHPHDSTD